ncbi:GUN4 domain-containing protein [Pseudanabaena sp. SR411]|uniref:GUN4 domain-containing protein n=1 Tax=Pseudanabaena sp. SR411 TaxID=1980935 RepID=UPI001C3DC189|nr:GUN4 domain-containing protein [Pseudanabaena sp. SR411]
MARNCAVIVGINDYDEISPLKYAKSDAERMRDFFMRDLGVGHDDLYFFTDDSPRNAQGRKTQPTYGTLKSFLGDRFANSFLSAGDTLWFYFSGHGMPCEGRDYLLPSDGNPRSIPDLAIPIGYVTERLRRSGADNVVMLIDACRSDGARNAGMGIGEEKQQGVITFFSCSPSQVSYEIDEIGQGAFTNVLLEALRIQGEGNCATVERFYQYLRDRVPNLTQYYKNGYRQTPYAVIEPATKLHYILLPKFANLSDIATLREDALHAEIEEDFTLAFQLWMRVNVASGGTDMKAINALIRVVNKRASPSSQPTVKISDRDSKSPSAPTVASPVPEVKKNPVELVSARGIDYRELEKLLKAREWRKADELTGKLMCRVAYRESQGYKDYLDEASIKIFPCEDLRTIDQLWMHYSNSKFGFSIQKKLWLECGGEIGKYDYEVWKKFAAKVGWYYPKIFLGDGRWRTYTEFMNGTQNAQSALPASLPKINMGYDGGRKRWGLSERTYLFSRAETCEV